MNSAVAYFIYHRPKLMEHSFRAIQVAQPSELFIIADGPKKDIPGDRELCEQARSLTEKIDWPCKVHRYYSDTNMGLKERLESGLDIVFDKVDQAMILEDDCVASPLFFDFCERMLSRYQHEKTIWAVNGSTPHKKKWHHDADYFYSGYVHVWGWATWADVWNNYRSNREQWFQNIDSNYLKRRLNDRAERLYWEKRIGQVRTNKVDSWAYLFGLYLRAEAGLAVTPGINMIENIGFGTGASHTTAARKSSADSMPLSEKNWIGEKGPERIQRNEDADRWYLDHILQIRVKRFPWNIFLLPYRIFHKLKLFQSRIFGNESS